MRFRNFTDLAQHVKAQRKIQQDAARAAEKANALRKRIDTMSRDNTVAQLRAIAQTMELSPPSKMRKAELVQMIIDAEDQRKDRAVDIYALVGMMNRAVHPQANGGTYTFLTQRSNNKPDLFISMSLGMTLHIQQKLDDNELRLDRPVRIYGYYVASRKINKDGHRYPDYFRPTYVENAPDDIINDPSQHIVRFEE